MYENDEHETRHDQQKLDRQKATAPQVKSALDALEKLRETFLSNYDQAENDSPFGENDPECTAWDEMQVDTARLIDELKNWFPELEKPAQN
jgi:hypothetical protein